MNSIKFETHYRRKNGEAQLYAVVVKNHARLRYATPVMVKADEWDRKRQRFTVDRISDNGKRSKLQKIRQAIENYLLAVDFGEAVFSTEAMNVFVDEQTGRRRRVETLGDLIKRYSEEVMANRINKRTGVAVCESTKRKFKYLIQRVEEYQAETNKPLLLLDLDTRFFELLREWLTKRYAPNTIWGKFLKPIKYILKYADEELGYKVNPAYKKYSLTYQKVHHVLLYKSEVQRLIGLDLSNNRKLEDYQIELLFGIFTGARPSDFTEFTKDNITVSPSGEPAIVFYTKKTKDRVSIPIPEQLQKILERRRYGLPKTSKNLIARNFKKICHLAGLDRKEQIGRTRAGEFHVTKGLLYQFVDGKTPKRTFVNGHYYGYLGEKWNVWQIADFTGNDEKIIRDHYIEKLSELEVESAKYDL